MIIALDAMGGDHAPEAIIKGAMEAVSKSDINLKIVGQEDVIGPILNQYKNGLQQVELIHAPEKILAEDTPTDAVKNKKNSSMMVGLQLVKKGEADAFISAGNTGALLAGATVTVGRIKGIDRPAIATLIPNKKSFTFLIDSGANADVKPSYLTQFALMGSIYMENIMGIANPKVGLINIGSEKGKGNSLTKDAYELLEKSDLNFIGNIEGNEISEGKADIIVCDGFTGNIILKYSEGLSMGLLGMIKQEIMADLRSKLAGALLKPAFKRVMKKVDASEFGGAPLLGLKGLVVKAHGGSNSKAIENAIKQCVSFIDGDITEKIQQKLDLLTNFSADA